MAGRKKRPHWGSSQLHCCVFSFGAERREEEVRGREEEVRGIWFGLVFRFMVA